MRLIYAFFFVAYEFGRIVAQKPTSDELMPIWSSTVSTTVSNLTLDTGSNTSNIKLERLKYLVSGLGGGVHRGSTVEDGGITYHIGSSGYRRKSGEYQTCHANLKDDYPSWKIVYDTDENVEEILFDCPSTSRCCGLDCCTSIAWWIIFLSAVAVIGIMILCFCICLRCKRTEKEVAEQVKEETDELLRTGQSNSLATKVVRAA